MKPNQSLNISECNPKWNLDASNKYEEEELAEKAGVGRKRGREEEREEREGGRYRCFINFNKW